MLKTVIASCVAIALGGIAACADEATPSSQTEVAPDDTADRPAATASEPIHAVPVKYVMDPKDSTQVTVQAGTQAAPPAAPASANPSAPRRRVPAITTVK